MRVAVLSTEVPKELPADAHLFQSLRVDGDLLAGQPQLAARARPARPAPPATGWRARRTAPVRRAAAAARPIASSAGPSTVVYAEPSASWWAAASASSASSASSATSSPRVVEVGAVDLGDLEPEEVELAGAGAIVAAQCLRAPRRCGARRRGPAGTRPAPRSRVTRRSGRARARWTAGFNSD